MISLEEARQVVHDGRATGVRCPCCSLWVQEYDRTIHSLMAVALIAVYRKTEEDVRVGIATRNPYYWFNVGEYLQDCVLRGLYKPQIRGDWPKLRWWGLLAAAEEVYGTPSPMYGITRLGVDFVNREVRVPRTVRSFNNRAIGVVDPGDTIDITDALGTSFSLNKVLGREEA